MRKIFIITERRADYSRFKPILKLIENDPELDYILTVTGAHLKKELGYTINEIIKDGFDVDYKINMFDDDQDNGGAMIRSFSKVAHELTFILEESKPDIILSGFDIGANMAVAITGAHMNIPVGHIQGGEVTGTIDESIRHAMTKFSHFHLASNKDATERLIKMGEKPDYVFDVGCPSIDAILNINDDPKVLKKYNLKDDFFILIQHPVTTEFYDNSKNIKETINALKEFIDHDVIIILPNNDAGYSQIVEQLNSSNFKTVESLGLSDYINLLKRAQILIGNSSSGIHEASSFNIPVINIGTRQAGRLRPKNVIDVDYSKNQIISAINEGIAIKKNKQIFQNPYGDGKSSERIIKILKEINLDSNLIQKQITY